ncbi:hypothetical protein ACFLWR_07375 [Chloroflexota bacterium]
MNQITINNELTDDINVKGFVDSVKKLNTTIDSLDEYRKIMAIKQTQLFNIKKTDLLRKLYNETMDVELNKNKNQCVKEVLIFLTGKPADNIQVFLDELHI